MADNSKETPVRIKKSYIDNYSIKQFVGGRGAGHTTSGLVDYYFSKSKSGIDPSLRNVGLIGMTTELISNVAEDGFNATSVLFRETFPNRAEIPESIYSHAAIFQLSNIFSSASQCTFLLVLKESEIIENADVNETTGRYSFIIDKDLTIYVEDVPYTLDYDIAITCVKKLNEKHKEEFLFTASYITNTYKNSISDITLPYIKVRRSINGYIALELKMHQCIRNVIYEQIVTNNKINMPTIDVSFSGQLVGFDILYKPSNKNDFTVQLSKLLVYSQPITTPFCYYQLHDENVLRITFNNKDGYFIPKFNSELKIILYITNGGGANFDEYSGDNVTIDATTTNELYDTHLTMLAKPVTGSTGGTNRLTLDGLQALTVEGYRTALALTTEPDLAYFFNNYQHRYGNFYIKFIKRRNDVYERIFGGFIVMKNDDYIYKTNTLDIDLNLYDMDNPEKNVYMIEPGTLFTYRTVFNSDAEIKPTCECCYDVTIVNNDDDSEKDENTYLVVNDNIPEEDFDEKTMIKLTDAQSKLSTADIGNYLRITSICECAKDSSIYNHDDIYVTFYRDPEEHEQYLQEYKNAVAQGLSNVRVFDSDYVDTSEVPDYLKNRAISYAEYCQRMRKLNPDGDYDDKKLVFDFTRSELAVMDNPTENKFVFINPFLIRFRKNPNLLSLYMTYINQTSVFELLETNDDAYVQFAAYDMRLEREFAAEKKYTITLNINSNINIDPIHPPVVYLNDKTKMDQNDLRVILVLRDKTRPYCFVEMYPVEFSNTTTAIQFKAEIYTDDFITSDGKLRLLQHGDQLGGTTNMTGNDFIFIPMEEVTCEIHTLYRNIYDPEIPGLAPISDINMTHHDFTPYMEHQLILNKMNKVLTDELIEEYEKLASTYDYYICTNKYTTELDPLTFMKPLNNVRSNLYFEDYMLRDLENDTYLHDLMDIRLESVPFVKWDLAFDEDKLAYFFKSYMSQYDIINSIIMERLRNETIVDVKFYNTYGKSANYIIGDNGEPLDMINLKIKFDIWFITGTDLLDAVRKVKLFIKSQLENINEYGVNQLHISNLMRKIEQNFSYVDHIRFRGINAYNSYYQSVRLRHTDLNEMDKLTRRKYVPELLVVDLDDIIINDMYSTDFVQ